MSDHKPGPAEHAEGGPPAGRWTIWGTFEGPVAYALSFVGAGLAVVLLGLILLKFWMTFSATMFGVLVAFVLWRGHVHRAALTSPPPHPPTHVAALREPSTTTGR